MSYTTTGGLFVDELLCSLQFSVEEEISLRYPMTFGEVSGLSQIMELVVVTERIFDSIEPKCQWRSLDLSAQEWYGRFQGRQIRGVSIARRLGQQVQVEIFLGAFPASLRQVLYATSSNIIPARNWVLPPGTDTTLPVMPVNEPLNAELQFDLADDVVLTSPVACKPIKGIADVRRVCGHSIQVYGGRASGPRLTENNITLSLWTGKVSDLLLEVANVIYWQDAQHVKVMAMAMRPWPVVSLFKARMQARTLSFLDASYFEN